MKRNRDEESHRVRKYTKRSTPNSASDYVKKKMALEGPVFSLDVECAAIGYTHLKKDRTPVMFSLVDGEGKTILKEKVKPNKTIVSYMTPWTRISKKKDLEDGMSLEQATKLLKSKLPSNAILVGQRIIGDIEWMNLSQSKDFQESVDLAEVFKSWHPKYGSFKCTR